MTYKEALTQAMTDLARDPGVCFIGYGVKYGRAMGTLRDVSEAQLIETTVAENLMVGLAHGLALAGRKPVVFIERMDFLLNAADALVNHLDKTVKISGGEFRAGVIIRCVVGNKRKALFTGETHTQNFASAFSEMLVMPVCELPDAETVTDIFKQAHAAIGDGESTLPVEFKDLL